MAGMARLVGLLVLQACSLAAWLSAAAPPRLRIVVDAAPGLERAEAAVRALAGGSWDTELELTGATDLPREVFVVLLPESSAEARTTPTWIAAFAMGASSTIVIFPARVPSYPDRSLETVLHHEMTHLLVARAAGFRDVPRWLHEGIATVAAREWGLEDSARFALAVIGQRPRNVAELDAGFMAGASAATRSYALSAAFVRYLRQRFGAGVPARILAGLARGRPLADAFALATGAELAVVESDFFGREVLWSTWLPFLTSSAALWIGISLLALMAIRRRRQRDAEVRLAWIREEGGLAGGASAPPGSGDESREDDPWRFN